MAKTKNLRHLRACRDDAKQLLDSLRDQVQQVSHAADVSFQELRTARKEFRHWRKLRNQYRQECQEAESFKSAHWRTYSRVRKELRRKIDEARAEIRVQESLKQSALASQEYFLGSLQHEDDWHDNAKRDAKNRTLAKAYKKDVEKHQMEIDILRDVICQLSDEITDARKVAEWVVRPKQQRLNEAVQKCRELRRELERAEKQHSAEVAEAKKLRKQIAGLEDNYQRLCQRIAGIKQRMSA